MTATTGTDFVRVVLASGLSKKMLKSLLTLEMSQITGLVAALAGKVATPTIKSQLGFIKADGSINGSGLEVKNIATNADVDEAFSGHYTVLEPFEYDSVIGYVNGVYAQDRNEIGEDNAGTYVRTKAWQLIFSDKGVFLRYWVGSWGNPSYVGGGFDNLSYTKAELGVLAGFGQLTPGTAYKLTDHGNDNGLIIQAATGSSLFPDGIRLGLVPKHYLAGVYDTNTWIGVWRASIGDAGVAVGNYAVYCGRVWRNLTGNIGTDSFWDLDATNWVLEPVASGDFYADKVFGVTYDMATDYISKQWDDKGNEFGEATEPTDGFLVEYNDWNYEINTYTNNKLSRCYNNRLEGALAFENSKGSGSVYNNEFLFVESGVAFRNNKIDGSIYGCSFTDIDITQNVLSIYGSIINSVNTANGATIYKNEINATVSNSNDGVFNLSVINNAVNGLTGDNLIRDDITPFKATTGQTLRLDTPVYEDINTAIANGKASPANYPTWAAFDTNLGSFTFALNDYLDLGTVEIPHSYLEGSNLEVHIHLATNGLNNATARKVKYTIFFSYGLPDNGANVFTAEASLTAELNIPANQAAKSVYYLSMGTITGTTIKIGTQLKMRVKRIAGTGTEPIADPFLGQVGVHYQKNTMGSRTISAK